MDLRQYAAAQDFTEEPTPPPPAPILAREQAGAAQDAERAREVYRQYQENIKASELAKTALRKGILQGLSPYRLLLLATEVVGRLTADNEFTEGTRSDLKLIYGELMGEPGAIELELEEVEARLDHMRAYQGENRGRVLTAIREHEHRAEELRSRIK